MKLKTYRSSTMGDALAQVKTDLGSDAVILHTRAYKVGAIFGLGGRPQVEVTATIAKHTRRETTAHGPTRDPTRERTLDAPTGPRRSALDKAYAHDRPRSQNSVAIATETSAAPALGSGPSAARSLAQAAIRAASRTGSAGQSAELLHASMGGSGTATSTIAANPTTRAAPALKLVQPSLASALAPVADESLRLELAAIRRMVGQVLQDGRSAGVVPMPEALLATYLQLLEAEVSRELADQITAQVRDELTATELADVRTVREAVCARLAQMLPSATAHLAPARSSLDRPFTITLVGPTGVGKTTTLAKLAAAHKLRHGRSVGLVTCDTYRIAAVEQLRTYAGIIGVPLKVALTPGEMARAMEQLSACDVVLIDTAGRSPSDAQRLGELREMVAAARPHQTHLVLSSAAGVSAMTRAAERFAPIRPDHVIFTKLDEAVSFGVLVETARKVTASLGCKLSYLTTGQEVPDDIEPSRPERLARLVLEGTLTP